MQLRDREPAGHARGPGFNPSALKKRREERKGGREGGREGEGREGKETKR